MILETTMTMTGSLNTPINKPMNTTHELTLERESLEQGKARYQKSREEAIASHEEAQSLPGVNLLKKCVEPVALALEQWIREHSGKAMKNQRTLKYLKGVDTYVVAYLTAQEVLNGISSQAKLSAVVRRIALLIEDEVRFGAFRKQNRALYDTIQRNFKSSANYDHKRKVLVHSANKAGVEWEKWPDADKFHIGQKCLDVFIATTGLVKVSHYKAGKNNTRIVLEATEETLEWLRKYDLVAQGLWPVYMPMVIPPRPWVSVDDGGYEDSARLRPPLVKHWNKNYRTELKNCEMPEVFRAVNAIQATPWRINKRVLAVMQTVWGRAETVGGLVSAELEPMPEKPFEFETNVDAKRAWKRSAAKVHVFNGSRVSKRMQGAFIVGLAEKFKDEPAIYFPCTLDFRSRVYMIPQFLNPQGSEHAKALLEFSEGKPLGNAGAYWLAIHGANCWGEDKVSMTERVAWVQKNSAWILQCASDPIANVEWKDADSPWKFLAFCFEWAGFIQDGMQAVSHIPVAIDGSCNGLQHFSAILKDPVGGVAVNLIPSDKPADIYQEVADNVNGKLNARMLAGEEMARKWVGLVDRKICKRPTMTLVYGSTSYGVRQQVFEIVRGWSDAKKMPEQFDNEGWDESVYLGSVIWESLGEVVSAAREAMAWLQDAATLAASEGLPLHWYTPVGFPVLQEYRELKSRRVKTQLLGKFVYLNVAEAQDKLNPSKQASGIAPNWVHSLDAAHLMKSVARCLDVGITAFAMIHDSYGTHACNVQAMGACLREAFVELHSVNRLNEFRETLAAQLTLENQEKLAPVPASGSLDLQAVLTSPYFFA